MRQGKKGLAILLSAGLLTGLTACGMGMDKYDFSVSYDGIERGEIKAQTSVHDPSIIEDNGSFYIFGSHMTAAASKDLRVWDAIGNGYNCNNKVYTDMKYYDSGEFDYTGNKTSLIPTDDGEYHVWAPDVIYNEKQGLYYMYYCTSSTFCASTICYGTSENIDGPYEWKGNLIYSGLTVDTIGSTDVTDYVDYDTAVERYTKKAGYEYNFEKYPNAIDPTVFYDKDGRMWMVYGSWSGGIFLLEIDENTGTVIHPKEDESEQIDAYFGKRLLGGGHNSIEAPYILYDDMSGFYYLFVSYGQLTREGGYQIRVFRSENVDGPYEDMNGACPGMKEAHAYYGLKLSGNYMLPGLKRAYKATGHNSALISSDGKYYVAYHTRFDNGTEWHEPRVKQFFFNEEGWPCLLPYATDGETIAMEGYETADLVGRYYVINQGMEIGNKVAEPFILYLKKDGTVIGEDVEGTWSQKDGSYYMHISYGEKEYSGIFCQMKDEAGSNVMTFSAVGNNESVWGVKY